MSIDWLTTVCLTKVTGHPLPYYTTNGGTIVVSQQNNGQWTVEPAPGLDLTRERPFVCGLGSLHDAVEFILGVREMFAPE